MMSKILKICIITFLIGVFAEKSFVMPSWFVLQVLFWLIILTIRFKSFLLIVLLIVFFFAFGYVRSYLSYPQINEDSIHYYRNEEISVQIRGAIDDNPDRRREKVNYFIDVEQIFENGQWKNVNGRILISSSLYPEYNYGDYLEVRGFLIEPTEFDSFSYKNYLSLYSVYSVMYRPHITKVSSDHGSVVFEFLFNIKNTFEWQLNKLYPEPMASFEAGLLTGSRRGIPDDLLNSFNLTGLTHIIAISGYNISLIIVIISSFFKKSSRRFKIPVIIVFIIVFTIFVGASAAVVRASIMGIIAVMALWFGRQSQITNALLLSAFFMVLLNPNTLVYDVGFQLSFLATLGLIVTGNYFQKLFSFLPEVFGLQEAFAMTISAQVFALPVILLNFERFSLISPIANICVAPFIPLAMFFGFISVLVSFVWFSAGFVLSLPGWLFLKISILFAEFLAKLPFASYEVKWFSEIFLFLYYALFVLSYFVYVNFRHVFVRDRRFDV